MHTYRIGFSRFKLLNGAILGTIAHAIWVPHHPEMAYEQSWDGPNYNIQNYAGAYGTITFAEKGVVGVFFDVHSQKSPFRAKKSYNLLSFFTGMPDDLLSLAHEEALQYVLQEYEGADRPIITAAFWSEDKDLIGAEPWQNIFNNGAHLVSVQLLETDAAIAEWQSNYELSFAQVDLLRSLFTRKIADPNIPIVLNNQEKYVVVTDGAEGVAESRELFKSIGIILS